MFPEMSASSFFAEVNRRAREVTRYRGRVSLMEHRREVRAQSYQPATSGGGSDVNGTAASIALMDFEARREREVEEHYAWVEAASKACYGPEESGDGGLWALLGESVADAVYLHYAEDMTWASTASRIGVSERQAERMADRGLAVCDLLGYSGLVATYRKRRPWEGVQPAQPVAC